MSTLKVLFIAGTGRSGSTILGNILGSIDGLFCPGEIYLIWKENLLKGVNCECGQDMDHCEVWSEVFATAFGGTQSVDVDRMLKATANNIRLRHISQILTGRGKDHDYFLKTTETLYNGIQDVVKPRVLVDTSKLPLYMFQLQRLPSIELYVLHLVRDARGVVNSWNSTKLDPATGEPMFRIGPVHASVNWVGLNLLTSLLYRGNRSRYCLMRYEDFISDPLASVKSIFEFIGEDIKELPFFDERSVKLIPGHTLVGNPSRFETGSVTLRPDEKWREKMSTRDKLITNLITAPLMWCYGYWKHET